ncbi:MAG: thiolase [Gammaproteobacteria bacterium]
MTLRYRAAIVGAAESTCLGVVPDQTSFQLALDAVSGALADCALRPSDIDGIAGDQPAVLAKYFGIVPAWADNTQLGGGSYLLHVRHAAAAIAAGLCTTVLVSMGSSGRSRFGEPGGRLSDVTAAQAWRMTPLDDQFETPYGIVGPTTTMGLGVMRYLADTGTTLEQLASVPVAQRRWAQRVPRAMYRDLISIDDVFASRPVCYPFHLLHCCLQTDGGGALVITTPERAADLPRPPVYLLGSGEGVETHLISQMEDLTSSAAFRLAARAAFAEAGIARGEVDHMMVYDAFAHLPLFALEDAGFVGRGEAGAFVAEGHTSPGGRLPLNTNGGGLSYTHTGAYGMFLMQEAIRQLRGEAAHQVPGVRISYCHAIGGPFWSAASLLLTNHAPG